MPTIKKNFVCRTCMEMDKTYVDIFDHRKRNKILSELLMECIPIKIDKFDGLPIYICTDCTEKLCAVWDFKSMVLASALKLQMRKDSEVSLTSTDNANKNNNISVTEENQNVLIERVIKHEIVIKDEDTDLTSVVDTTKINHAANQIEEITLIETVLSEVEERIELSDATEKSNMIGEDKNLWDENDDAIESNFEDSDCDSTDYVQMLIGKRDNQVEKLDIIDNDKGKGDKKDSEDCNDETEKRTCIEKTEKRLTKHSEVDEDGLPIMKDGRKLTRKEKLKMTVFCKHCNRSFGWKYYKTVHIKLHTGEKPHKCDVCGKAFVLPFQLKVHQQVHENEPRFSCDICGKRFKQPSAIFSHKLVHTEERPHKCHLCDKGFKNTYTLGLHVRTHSKEKRYMCETCGKSFSDNSSFSSHKVKHQSTDKTYPCPICGKVFATNIRMRAHQKRHSQVKPYVCTYCGKAFGESATMKIHSLVHTGEKPHSCNICGKKFRQIACLPRHMRIHTGETPFPCELCPSRFKYKHHLQNHMKVHKS